MLVTESPAPDDSIILTISHLKVARGRMGREPIQDAAKAWLDCIDDPRRQEALVRATPRRFTVYEPMVLLPAGSFGCEAWMEELRRREEEADSLWANILREVGVMRGGPAAASRLTHLAVNEAIPRRCGPLREENSLRAPVGLRILFGESRTDERGDFDAALWVSTKQNGIVQIWAPRWTMFSRGNVKEKARLLRFPSRPPSEEKEEEEEACWAVDLYAGIGYFAFSFVALGMRALCWEMNEWSVEGLRRGARANGWSVRVVDGLEPGLAPAELLAGGENMVVFRESNEAALPRIRKWQSMGLARRVEHVNCGFLPTSEPTWLSAWQMTWLHNKASWLHLHENVGVNDIETRRECIQRLVDDWSASEGRGRTSSVEHVELVKTFAPGVWHCVFDVHVAHD
ncbi:hypothetical protein L249_7179 [Ophiocordyceps polyrhachis-furcata BCC 54312]|uniref:tRNA wybutosine-synthesizing protein 2 n=1 Tax=Ophiocordyceps polyrhachis-furcata BCC 54312 TaxID=1330021 RepID=A0A367LBM9_9HYPO|nr:hypothetical protein L249_7179 [Ophiocordyceps polyrhachis-furcata BCC 54312]